MVLRGDVLDVIGQDKHESRVAEDRGTSEQSIALIRITAIRYPIRSSEIHSFSTIELSLVGEIERGEERDYCVPLD